MSIKGIIFDLDGVICSTDEYHYLAWKAMADNYGIYFDRVINNRLRGVSRMTSLDIILENYHGRDLTDHQKLEMAAFKNDLYRSFLKQMSPYDLKDEVKNSLDALKEMGIRIAIGSSSKNAPLILERIGLDGYFDAVCDGNDISNAKPDPEVFLKAAERLGLKPYECLVVEDAVSGAEAGHNGGFAVIALGDAAKELAGDHNIRNFPEIVEIVRQKL